MLHSHVTNDNDDFVYKFLSQSHATNDNNDFVGTLQTYTVKVTVICHILPPNSHRSQSHVTNHTHMSPMILFVVL